MGSSARADAKVNDFPQLLTSDGALQHRITGPKHKLPKTYVVQVEGEPDENALQKLRSGSSVGIFYTLFCASGRGV